jgi:serine/threonine protein kinase
MSIVENSASSSRAACPRCGRTVPADAVLGACPACLLAAGFASEPAAPAATPSPPSPAELAPEFPELELIELLGRGGMGAVYKARQRSLDRLVALKLLRPGLDADTSFAERFTREARALAQLNHPGIVTLYEFGRTPGGLYFILMEFVDGLNLRQLLAAGRLSPREALAIIPPLCDALQYAHDRGFVHRDIKPENLLIDRLGRVKVADFGLAKLTASSTQPTSSTPASSTDAKTPPPSGTGHWSLVTNHSGLTEAGKVMGTPGYMAPEQREQASVVDHRADIYALGVVLYQLLTGELPDKKQLQPPSHRVQIDVRLDEIVLRALETNPGRRYSAASELKTQVERITRTTAEKEKPTPEIPASASRRPWYKWKRVQITAGVGLVVLLLRTFVIAPFRLEGSSVEPEIPAGSLAFVDKLDRHFSPGDIVAYQHDASFVYVARITAADPVDGKVSITRREQPPTLIPTSAVIGKVVFNTRPSRETAAAAQQNTPADSASGKIEDMTSRAISWLHGIDDGRYAGSWQTASTTFRKNLTETKWVEMLTSVRAPLGQALERRSISAQRIDKLPETTGGPHQVIQFSTRFEKFLPAIETVTFTRDTDGQWRASGYLIKPDLKSVTPLENTSAVTTPITGVVEKWLQQSDEARYAENWAATSPLFKQAMTETDWAKALTTVRAPLGKVVKRVQVSAQQLDTLAGVSGGPHQVLQFATAFENEPDAVETVTFTRDADGEWRASGYFIK